jgi:hypothetical protein
MSHQPILGASHYARHAEPEVPGPVISLLHPTARVSPSAQFPRGWKDAHDTWLAAADHPENIEYVLAVHESRWQDFHAQSASSGRVVHPTPCLPNCVCGGNGGQVGWATGGGRQLSGMWHASSAAVVNVGRDCVVDQLNRAAEASRGKVLVGVQDDLYPPKHWDTLILEALEEGADYPESQALNRETILLCSSGATPERDHELMMCGAMTRAIYERRGFCLDPDFESMYADNWHAELSRREEAAGLLRIIERLDIQFDHRRTESDDVYALQNRPQAYEQGFATFQRKANGIRVMALLVPGEKFSHRWVFGMFDVLSYLFPRFIVKPYGAHTSDVFTTRMELADAVIQHATAPRADLILTVDDDNVISPENVDMLVADLDARPELSWVAGWCWCDTGDYENNPFRMSCGRQGPNLECKRFTVEDHLRWNASGKLAITTDDLTPDALWSGMPVVLMRGSMMETLGWEAFLPMLGKQLNRGHTSEDTTFFYQAHKAGLKGAVDLRVKVPHLKLRAIEPQILPASDREKYLDFLEAVSKTPSHAATMEASAAD